MSERTVYAIASGKGGVGKTTSTINLGAMLADGGHSVVVVDTDLGMANLADFLEFEIEPPTLHEVLAGEADSEAAVDEAPGGIDVLPSATDIEAFTKSDPANLDDVVAALREAYDYVLLDTGAGVSYDTLVPLALADAVLLVATPDVASVRDTAKTGELAERVETEVAGAVLTQRSSNILNADDVEETLSTDVLAVVPEDEAVPMGIDAGRPLASFAPNAPAGRAYRTLAGVVTGEVDPDPEFETDDSSSETAESADEQRSEADSEATAEAEREADADAAPDAPAADAEASVESDAPEDSLGPDAARSVGDALDGESDPLFDESADDAASANAADETAEPADARSGSASVEAAGEPTESDGIAGDEARSVDDLIDEHISDDRLGGERSAAGDDSDPLAQLEPDDAGSERADLDLDEVPEGDAATDGDEGAPETEDADDPVEASAESAGVSEVPFRDDGSSETPSEASIGGTGPGEEISEPTPDREAAADGEVGEADAEVADERDAESEGVFGRISSLFK
ncbi:ATPase [Halobacteriales archaeon QS_1_67_19]|nr:MAG: ATPase [Halobacteriales archaeon QS_1_67_19]